MSSATDCVATLVDHFQKRRPIRAGSLIITVYGDAIAPRGGMVWLGSLSKLVDPIGINERLVRTSVYRLTRETWLQGEKVGRRSYYSLSGPGRRRFEQAFKRVYHGTQPPWSGQWTLVLLTQLEATHRQKVREELEWLGFGHFAPGVLAHPTLDRSEAIAALQEQGAAEEAIVMQTKAMEPLASKPLRLQVRESWNLDALADNYQRFLTQFRPLWKALNEENHLGEEDCFIARTLLIHEYRKVQLRDPQLPDELLPTAWEGRNAHQLCRNIYRTIYQRAERWLDRHLETAEGPLPAPGPNFYQRFGGLE
ncbi:phenylacetic acid degradation operon negative regulatory protein PaaX [Halomonas campisalis]|uniref:Phenylacetic acid degradation operon negative regulatory protein PaaX n=1 Tax=Billgrantia campisalis TaxID=74661 RepID=A0ABS9P4V1_9GAMM|nr:phenylacetic acid degradation operon negative regulatory protein PaaX [Halomonas campisalis]MCG6656811.1 phenylacetic acid degradation operon negative regulatory protein PaaX [Halomonas campisalis]MDR5862000.1 phenylacetic acid degradation operon negative regulatory protein PaaX [Halomonas campisalis]